MNILIFADRPHMAVNWYRGTGVYRYLGGCDTVTVPMNWDSLINYDVLVVIRPASEDRYNTIMMAKECGLKVIVDFDDDYFTVPASSIAYEALQQDATRNIIVQCMYNADVVTVSTEAIKRSAIGQGIKKEKIRAIPNAWNDYHRPFNPVFMSNKSFFLRGDEHAWNDIQCHINDIKALSDKYDLYTIGNMKQFYYHCRLKAINYMTPPFYFSYLNDEMSCRVALKPMMPNEFNQSKSNCAWIEATAAGSVTVVSEGFPEFDKPGVVQSNNFYSAVEQLMENDKYAEKMFMDSKAYILDNLVLSKVNELRKCLI